MILGPNVLMQVGYFFTSVVVFRKVQNPRLNRLRTSRKFNQSPKDQRSTFRTGVNEKRCENKGGIDKYHLWRSKAELMNDTRESIKTGRRRYTWPSWAGSSEQPVDQALEVTVCSSVQNLDHWRDRLLTYALRGQRLSKTAASRRQPHSLRSPRLDSAQGEALCLCGR